MDVSIILPCYNEADVLERSVLSIRKVMDKTAYSYEIIIAEDNSTDGTADIAKRLSEQFNNVVWLHRSHMRGRGSAVAEAIKKSKGRIAGFIDVDLETPARYIYPIVLEIENGADISTCIRVFKLTTKQLFFRLPKVMSHFCYIWLVRKMLGIKLEDIEAGFKFFNKERILPVLDEVKDTHWFWDTEIMVRAYYKGYKIRETPTLFLPDYKRKSKVNLLKDSYDYIVKLFKFRKELKVAKKDEEIKKQL